ncbi:CobW/HypB/UreG domain protein [Rhizoctonia solani AG-3 Rhs1AP]|uniref:CobW/HypB/UreG domain protein n=1 Tax=Rhizoctonia solani AG-3 Rhs1AP TaxID=1086054 RepID=X8J6E4_9AGAM|nr:CobW/HypB/UreG domain protein [Rhizoctonia solani AG-3 Rhs1AP]
MGVKTAIPVTVFTGFLGAGKTTIILSLLQQLPKDYQVVLLKNEFGDVEVDSQLASNSSLAAVSEILNGCMCCILVGQMKTALLEIRDKYRPDRIIIESSGSAFPATLAFQIRELERETDGDFKLDAIVTVVDAENFRGYEDTSPTAKMQAQYTDVILINKWEHVSERDLDIVLDHLGTLNDLTPKLRCQGKSGVPHNLLFGLDSKQFLHLPPALQGTDENHHDEIETATVCKGTHLAHTHSHDDHSAEPEDQPPSPLTRDRLSEALEKLPTESIYRVKGFVRFGDQDIEVLNWAFGRFELVSCATARYNLGPNELLLTVMGARGETKRYARKLGQTLGARLQ